MKYAIVLLISLCFACPSSSGSGNTGSTDGGTGNDNPSNCELSDQLCCDVECDFDTVCIDGTCHCPGDSGKACNPASDTHFAYCNPDGSCEVFCDDFQLDCNDDLNDGCETAMDDNNCGGCGTVCGPGGTCSSSFSCDVFMQIEAGAGHTCGFRSRGGLVCCGDNTDGQLGDASYDLSSEPVALDTAKDWEWLDSGLNHTCAASQADDEVYCWGDNSDDQIGTGSANPNYNQPTGTGVSRANHVGTGFNHSCAVRVANWDPYETEVLCWGSNSHGQIGNGSTGGTVTTPTKVNGLTQPIWVAAGEKHTCIREFAGEVYCWGDNSEGQVGRPGSTSYTTPQKVVTDAGATTDFADGHLITAGRDFTCAIDFNYDLWCWGSNRYGQLGSNGTMGIGEKREYAAKVDSTDRFDELDAFDYHICAVNPDDSTVHCWGRGFDYTLGDGSDNGSGNDDANSPSQVTGINNAFRVGVGASHSCVITQDWEVLCWGSRANGALCDGNTTGNQKTPAATLLLR